MNAYEILAQRNKMKQQAALAPLGAGGAAQSETKRNSLFSQIVGKDTTEVLNDVLGDSSNNRVLKGAAYLGLNVAGGFASSIEGIWDWGASGLTKLVGETVGSDALTQWAEDNLATDWFDYSAPDEWYKPTSTAMKIAGEVAQGIGTSLPSLLAVGAATAATVASGGTASPALIAALSGTVSALGAAGNAVKQAYLESGELGGEQFGYGAAVGATEGVIEGVSSLIGVGTGKVVKAVSGNAPKLLSKGIGKTILSLGGDMLSEGAEEVVAEALDPVYKRMTYDENAEWATPEQLMHAGMVGALSGLVMTGTMSTANITTDTVRGQTANNKGETATILKEAQAHVETERKSKTGSEIYEAIEETYDKLEASLAKTNGEVKTLDQKRMVGALRRMNVSATMAPMMYHEAANIIANADTIASRIESGVITDENGNKLTITAEAIREGFDPNNPKSIAKAIKNNSVLRALTAQSVSGKIMYNTDKFAQEMITGGKPLMETEYNAFLEGANQDELNIVGENLGITDWSAETDKTVNERLRSWNASGKAEVYRRKIDSLKKAKTLDAKTVEDIPTPIRLGNGKMARYKTDNADIAIENDNNTFYIYDLGLNQISMPLSRAETNKVLRQYNEGQKALRSENMKPTEAVDVKAESKNENFAIERTIDNTPFVEVEQDILDGVAEDDWIKTVKTNLSKKFPNGVQLGKNVVKIDSKSRKEMTFSKYMQWLRNNDPQAFSDKLRATDNADEILVATQNWVSEGIKHQRKDSITDFARGTVLIRVGNNDYSASVIIGTQKNGKMLLYDIINMAPAKITKKETAYAIPGNSSRRVERKTQVISKNIIPNSTKKVNPSEQNSSKTTEKTSSKTKYQLEAEQNDAILRDKLGENYTKLTEPNKGMIRKIMRQAKAKGMSEADALTLARISAHSGVDITVSKEMCMRYKLDEDGNYMLNENGKRLVWYADGYYDPSTGKIVVNPESTRADTPLLIHEFLHASTKSSNGTRHKRTYNKLLKLAKESLTDEQIKEIEDRYGKVYDGNRAKIDEEIIAESSEIFASEQFVESLVSKEPNIAKRMISFFKGASEYYADDKRLSKQARKFYKLYKQLYNSLSGQRQNTNASSVVVGGDGERFALPDGKIDVDPKSVTEEEVKLLLTRAANKVYKDSSYIPIRVNTPQILIEVAQDFGEHIDNLPIIMNVEKARQTMATLVEWQKEGKTTRAHELSSDDVISIIKAMDKPKYIIYQTSDERFVEIVEFETTTKDKAVAVIEIGENKNPEYLNGYKGGKYQVLITAFSPDVGTIDSMLNNRDNRVLYPRKKKGSSQRGSGNKVPSHFNDSPFAISITDSAEKVNTSDENFALPKNFDKDYLEAVKRGDMDTAQRMVDEAAKKAGYTDKLYHGTKQFGFTEFDPAKSDDKISIFVAGSDELAQTYSGRRGVKKISATASVDTMPIEEVVTKLSDEVSTSYDGEELSLEYEIMRLSDVNKLIGEVNEGVERLQETVNSKIKELANKMAEDFTDTDADAHQRLRSLKPLLDTYQYENMSTPIYMLLHYTNVFSDNAAEIADLEYKIRLMNKLQRADTSNGVVVKKDLGGYGISILTFDEARIELKDRLMEGNYALYGNPKNQLVIDCRGQNWNDIRNWTSAVHFTKEGTTVERSGEYFRLFDKKTGNEIFHGRFAVNMYSESLSTDMRHIAMLDKANNNLDIRAEYMHTTRDIARFAKEHGYESVKFENIVDNGGMGKSTGAGDVYAYFEPNNLKSADPVTYDDNGNIIPLSERFNPKKPDIRHAMPKNAKPEPLEIPDYDVAYGAVAEQTKPKTLMDYVATAAYSTAHPVETAKTVTSATLDWTGSALIGTQIAFVNEQAGYENAMKRMGRTDGEATVQAVRAASNRAQEMLGATQAIKQNGKLVEVGDGWQRIVSRIKKYGENAFDLFEHYLFHKHNIDRMSLEERSIAKNEADKQKLDGMRKTLEDNKREIAIINAKLDKLKGIQSRAATIERAPLKEKRKALLAENKALAPLINTLQKKVDNFVPEQNKPVLGKKINDENVAITAEESKAICEKYEKDFSWMLEESQAVYNYLDNLMKERIDAGLISEQLYLQLKEKYPNYVPTYRTETTQGTSGIGGKYDLRVNKTIKTAKGGLSQLESLDKSIGRMTMQVIRASEINRMGEALVEAAESDPSKNRYIELTEDKQAETLEQSLEEAEGNAKQVITTNQVTIYRGGEKYSFRVTPQVFAAFNAFNSQPSTPFVSVELMAKGNTLFKRLVTSLNPFFTVRNFVRDFQDAIFNSRHPVQFVINYARAINEISRNGSYWRMYRQAGGLSASVFDYQKGLTSKPTKHGFTASENRLIALITSMERLNMAIEQMPRLAEFISSVESGSSINQALLNAADVTTNFARSGKITKHLNRTIIPFLNPAIQGTSKLFRNFSDAFDYKHPRQMAKAFAILTVKAAILGVIPMVFNQFLYDDDEEYNNLRDSDKENYYLFKIGDTFFKLPRGRVQAAIAGMTNRTMQELRGEDADWSDYASSVVSNLTPVENFSRPIWAPLQDLKNNTTWYGGTIEGQQFENTRPRDRYDESTSSIAIAIGQVTGHSPKKIHYLIDQYSGVIGDFLLPLTTQKAERNVILGNFTIDPVSSNKLSDDFYDIYEDVQYRKTDGDVTAKYQLKYMNDVKSAISTLYDEKAKIQKSDLSDGEKLQQTRVVQALINQTYQSFLDSYDTYTDAIKATQGVIDETDESQVKLRYAEINRQTFGAAKALEEYNKSVYESATMLNKAGMSYDTYYNLYFSTLGLASDTDEDGSAISGSKRAKILSAINATNADIKQKMLYFASKGYSIKDGDFNRLSAKRANKILLNYILSQKNLTKAEKTELAEKCGFKVKNGKIVTQK